MGTICIYIVYPWYRQADSQKDIQIDRQTDKNANLNIDLEKIGNHYDAQIAGPVTVHFLENFLTVTLKIYSCSIVGA